MKNINFRHSIIFFLMSVTISPVYLLISHEPIMLCLFLILVLGISHGSLDNIKGKKLLKFLGYKSIIFFYLVYLVISFTIIILWWLFPNIILFIFLIVAAFHFGKEDTIFSYKREFFITEFLFFLKGSCVIIAPLLFQREATNEIFNVLNFNLFESRLKFIHSTI